MPAPETSPQGLTLGSKGCLLGTTDEMQKIFALVKKLSKVPTTVLIHGESGTGKELIARAIHHHSPRAAKPFVAVNCGAIPDTLIESELFGHEKGAFSGADRRREGRFQFAEGGTLFLDEVGDITPAMQVKILRVLQERCYTPVGSNQEHPTDVRLIAATHRDLEAMVDAGTFRQDLFYRLHVVPIEVPPLRLRRSDILALADHFIEVFAKSFATSIQKITPDFKTALLNYPWPGNVRELENVIEHAFVVTEGQTLTAECLPKRLLQKLYPDTDNDSEELCYPQQRERFERHFITKALIASQGRINLAAQRSKIPKVTLLRKLEKYSIDPKEFRLLN